MSDDIIPLDELLKAVECGKNAHLDNASLEKMAGEKTRALALVSGCSQEQRATFFQKLLEYRYIDEIHELSAGKHVRWIRFPKTDTDKVTLTNGGIIVNIKFTDTGTQVLTKNGARFIQYKFDDCLTFQKLSADEQLILAAYEHAKGMS